MAAPKTLEKLAQLASITVDDLKVFEPADFEELTKELGLPVTAKVKLRELHRNLLAIPEGIPKRMQIEVVCPEGAAAGDTITVVTDDGNELEIEVPEGCGAGDSFDVQIGDETDEGKAPTGHSFEPAGILASGGSNSVRKYRHAQTLEEVAGKHHTDRDSFAHELSTLQRLVGMDKGKEVAMELKGFDEAGMILFVELAKGTLAELLKQHPSGLVSPPPPPCMSHS